ncbi:MAG: intradiol ring-cleavage dioxygenase [Chryseolinea sp.]
MERKSFLASFLLLPFAKFFGRPHFDVAKECKTHRDAEGPYYKEGAPLKPVIETDGEALTIAGTVFSSADCSMPVANATIDIWHCNAHGDYDNDGFKCRGLVKTDSKGRYTFKTIYPPSYGSRPRHIHFKVRAAGFPELTSQIYFKGDPHIQNDFARNAETSRVLSLAKNDNILHGDFDIYI